MARVRSSVCALRDWNIRIVLTWIPSHSDISFNDKADLLARQALQDLPTTSRNPFTFPTWKSLTVRQMTQCWQIRWDRSITGGATYDVLQAVGNRTVFPENRNVAISYVRLLLSDTTLWEHQYRMGLVNTKLCENNDELKMCIISSSSVQDIQTSETNWSLSLIHIWRCRRIERCRSRWSPYH